MLSRDRLILTETRFFKHWTFNRIRCIVILTRRYTVAESILYMQCILLLVTRRALVVLRCYCFCLSLCLSVCLFASVSDAEILKVVIVKKSSQFSIRFAIQILLAVAGLWC